MDSTSQSAFMTGVWGDDTTKWKEATARLSDPEWLEERYEVVRTRLRLIESFLAASDGPFLLGEKVSHADFSVFGAYAWCRVNKEMAQAVWRHHSMPNLGKWLDAMLQGGLVETKRLKR